MNRRKLLKIAGASVGTLGVAGVAGRYLLIPPSRSRHLATVDELTQRLYDGFSAETRAATCVPYDHPLRQYHNRGVWTGGEKIWRNFSWDERSLLVDLFYAGLSEAGRERVPKQFFVRWPGIHIMKVLFCGDPTNPPYQVIFSAPHLNLRVGGQSREGVAFGGPQVYGDQRGDGRVGLPGNLYRYQLELAKSVFERLSPGAREHATFANEPVQTQIELRGASATPPGVPIAELPRDLKDRARAIVDSILENYPDDDADYARACLAQNGDVDALALSHYENGEEGRSGDYQIFRLEGPAAVFHFRGHPHLHAFVNVGMDGDAPLSVGEPLGDNPTPLEDVAVRALFESALRDTAGTDAGYYPLDSVVGRLRSGTIRTGDLYNLESWQNEVAVIEVEGAGVSKALREALERQDVDLDPSRTYTVATTSYAAGQTLGRVASRGPMVRDALIAHIKANGFPSG